MFRRCFFFLLAIAFVIQVRAADASPGSRRLPTIWLIGDSTVRNGTRGQQGWGTPFAGMFDPAKVRIENRALGGRSSRSFRREGLWEAVRKELQPGDFVLIQFGHNDNGPIDREKARASLKSNGEETKDVTIVETGTAETVHSYGWYLRSFANEAKAAGATPIILSLVARNIWVEGKVVRATESYAKWAAEAAKQCGAEFIDLNALTAARFEADGEPKVHSEYFSTADHTHTTPAGAAVNAQCVIKGLQGLKDCPLKAFFKDRGPE